ncbi:MAG: hypothetical protein U7M05_11350, partial [Candidatus Igneacidithiobacillus chanchocoensis]
MPKHREHGRYHSTPLDSLRHVLARWGEKPETFTGLSMAFNPMKGCREGTHDMPVQLPEPDYYTLEEVAQRWGMNQD